MALKRFPGVVIEEMDEELLLYRPTTSLCKGKDICGCFVGRDHGKLVPPVPARLVNPTDLVGDGLSHFFQQPVADVVSIGIVDLLEPVDISNDE